MTLEQALAYATAGIPVLPCTRRKIPLIESWPQAATCEPAIIRDWWHRWPLALIGMPTGPRSGRNVLDIDVKDPCAYGFDTLAELGFAILPVTAMSHTASGGLHLHFRADVPIRNTAGKRGRGIGPGLDWRGDGGYVVLPSEGSGYWWDPVCGPETALASIPVELLPREPEVVVNNCARPVRPAEGLSPYAHAALKSVSGNRKRAKWRARANPKFGMLLNRQIGRRWRYS